MLRAEPGSDKGIRTKPGPDYDIMTAHTLPGPVPAVSEWGLIVMALLALTAGTILFAHRQRAPLVL